MAVPPRQAIACRTAAQNGSSSGAFAAVGRDRPTNGLKPLTGDPWGILIFMACSFSVVRYACIVKNTVPVTVPFPLPHSFHYIFLRILKKVRSFY